MVELCSGVQSVRGKQSLSIRWVTELWHVSGFVEDEGERNGGFQCLACDRDQVGRD